MKVSFIGGTWTISMAITRQLAMEGHEVFLLNRGSRKKELPESVKTISKELQVEDLEFDRWCDKVVAVLEKAKKEF